MTLALPTRPARHRLAEHGQTYLLVTPPRTHRPTSHRRRRSQLLQISVRDLTPAHSPVRASLSRRAGRGTVRGLFETFVWAFGSDDWRKPR